MNIKVLTLMLIAALGLSSCKKYNDAPIATLVTNLNATNATSDTLNFYLNGTRLNNNSNIFPSGASGYIPVSTLGLQNTQNYQFKKAGTPLAILSVPLKLDSNKYYSLFVPSEQQNDAFAILDSLNIASDRLNAVTAGKVAMVRFVNASVGSGSLNMAVGDTVKLTNQSFKSGSGFVVVGAGLKSITVYQSGSATPVIAGKIPLQIGRIYTLFAKGLVSGTGNLAFGVGITVNR